MANDLLDVHGVARKLGVSRSTVLRLVKAGVIPPGVKLRRSRRWTEKQVERAVTRVERRD